MAARSASGSRLGRRAGRALNCPPENDFNRRASLARAPAGRAAWRRWRRTDAGSRQPAGHAVRAGIQSKQIMKTASCKKLRTRSWTNANRRRNIPPACPADGPEVFRVGRRAVVEARDGIARAAGLSKLKQESLCRLVSRNGSRRRTSLHSVLSAPGLKIIFAAA